MFVRKGTRRKKQQSSRRANRSPLTSQRAQSDPELGQSSAGVEPPPPARSSNNSSCMSLNEEKTLVDKGANLSRLESFPPANYGSIFLQLREAHMESVSLCDFVQRIVEIVWQSFITTVVLLLLLGLPISMFAVGTSYLEECPKEPRIPVYLLVGGAFGLVHLCILLWQQRRSRSYMLLDESKDELDSDEADVMTRSYRFTLYVLTAFLLVWFGLGNFWLFSVWRPNFTLPLHEPRNWCARTLYLYTFYQVLTCYSLLGVCGVFLVACLIAYVCIRHQ